MTIAWIVDAFFHRRLMFFEWFPTGSEKKMLPGQAVVCNFVYGSARIILAPIGVFVTPTEPD